MMHKRKKHKRSGKKCRITKAAEISKKERIELKRRKIH